MPINREELLRNFLKLWNETRSNPCSFGLMSLPHGWEGRDGEEGNRMDEKAKLFNRGGYCTGTNPPRPFASLLGCTFFSG